MIRRKIVLFGIIFGVFLALAVCFWPRPRPHLLLITLDTTRADRLGCYGHPRGRTPVLDGLAASGVLCERAYTVAPLTLPAHASLFTGVYPAESGIRTNGRGRLDDSLPVLAEILKRQGYATAAFVASFVLNRKFGLDRGFQTYDDEFGANQPVSDEIHHERSGQAVVDCALKWLGQKHSKPFFCWVHLYDPHSPYSTHADHFGDEFADRPYDAEIAYVDRQIGRLLEFLQAHRLNQQTLVVVVGDHGEGLGEHVERTHGSTLYNATMHVPLIIRDPGRLPAGHRVATDLSLVDVTPTILDLLAVAAPRQITGRSLQAVLSGSSAPSSPCLGATDEPFLANGWSPLRCLTEGNWKYIRTTRVELYNLATDPGERCNLAEGEPETVRAMEARLTEFESRLVMRSESRVQLSAAERRALASLGYAGSGLIEAGTPDRANLLDIKDMLPFDNAVEDAQKLIEKGMREAAVGRLREIIRQVPSHTSAHLCLGNALRNDSRFEEAMDVLRALVAVRPNCRDGHYGLGLMFLERARDEEAVHEFLKAVEIDPDFAEPHYYLAKCCMGNGQIDEALAHFDAAIEIDRYHINAYQLRAQLLANLGRIDAAIADFERALQCAPGSAEIHHNLGQFLAAHGDPSSARQHLLRAVELSPSSPEIRYALGDFLLRQGEFDEAVEHLGKAVELRENYVQAEHRLQEALQASRNRESNSE